MQPRSPALVGLLVGLLLAAPLAAADHPGSNMGLARFGDDEGPGGSRLVHRVTDVEAAFARWETAWPDLVERFDIGSSTTGLPLLGVVVTDETVAADAVPLSTGKKLVVYLDGGHHGNEYLGAELIMYYLEDVLTRHSAGDADAVALLRETEIHAVPIVNPEGNFLDTRKNGRQVDLNRNYPFEWGGPGSGDTVADLTYRGPEALSEPESRANADYGAALSPDAWVTMHSGVAEFYWPWGWTHDPSPDDAMFTSLEAPFEEATNGRVDAMQAAELYLAAGATDDYAYAVVGTAGFTYEVHEDQFVPVYGEPIGDIIADQLAGLDFVVENAKHMGAWVEPTATANGLVLENLGWGVARNVTVTFPSGATSVLEELAVGASVTLDVPEQQARGAKVAYPILLIETSRVRTHALAGEAVAPSGDDAATVPAAGAALGALVLVAALALRRRAH